MRRVRKHEFTVFECLAKGPCSQAKNTAILHKPMQAKHSERRHHTRTLPPGCPANLKSSAHQSMAAAACGVEVTINKRNFSLQLPARGPEAATLLEGRQNLLGGMQPQRAVSTLSTANRDQFY
jgi:hypothetical protein